MSQRPREFSRSEYRRQVAWTRRIEREGPFLEDLFRQGPAQGVVLDAGCGTGEHTRFAAAKGYTAVGIDLSRDAVAMAAEAPCTGRALWARGDLRHVPLRAGAARAALCLGNTLVILGDDAGIQAAVKELHRVLLPGGHVLIQILNYHRLRSQQVRHLPLNFRETGAPGGGGELVYLRLMDFIGPDHVDFHVITLQRQIGEDAVSVVDSVRRRLRSLEHEDLASMIRKAGFDDIRLLGDYAGARFEPDVSPDVIVVARRRG